MTSIRVTERICPCLAPDCCAVSYRCVATHPSLPAGFVISVTGLTRRQAVLEAYDVLTMGQGVWPVHRATDGSLRLRDSLAKDGTR